MAYEARSRPTPDLRSPDPDQHGHLRFSPDGTSLSGYLRAACAAGTSLVELGRVTGLGRTRLRTAMAEAGIAACPSGRNTSGGKRSRTVSADPAAAGRVGTGDLCEWLRQRRSDGWTLT
jgi:hypothetical protein